MKNVKLTLKILSIAVLFMAFTVSCDKDDDNDKPVDPKNIVEVAASDPQFSTLVSALQSTDLDAALIGTGPFTVFAPTDQAFEALGIDLSTLTNEQLAGILTYHVVSGKVLSSDLSEGLVETLNGAAVTITLSGGVKVDDANVVTPDVMASNGVIHVIDKVILPPSQNIVEIAVAQDPEFTTLVAALQRVDLDVALSGEGPFTVFAPTNQAFEDLGVDLGTLTDQELTDILLYHVVSGKVFSTDLSNGTVETLLDGSSITVDVTNLKINDSNLVTSLLNIQGTNGVIHVIDAVLLPPAE